MEELLTFAKSDMGAILGGGMIFIGIATYTVINAVILPKLRERKDEMAEKRVQVIIMVGKFDFLLFGTLGATFLYFHWA